MVAPDQPLEPFPLPQFQAFCRAVRIQTKDFGLVKMEMLGTQTYILDEMCAALDRGVSVFYILKARQLGTTTFFLLLDLFWCFKHSGLLASFIAHTDQAKANFRNVIKLMMTQLPKSHKVKWDQENRDMIVLKNASVMQYLVAGTKEKIKGGLGRSSANNYIHATEVAFWGSPDDLNELAATMSTHYPHRMWIEETTANGFNFWQERWAAAKDDPTICCIFVGWWRHDHYSFDDAHPHFPIYMPKGHASPLTRLELRRVNEVKKRYGVEINRNQLAWYRWKLNAENGAGGDQVKMDEMFPFLEEDAFVSTGAQFFSSQHITEASRAAARTKLMPFRYQMGDHWSETRVENIKQVRNAELKIWEEADAAGHYVIGCDPAYGSGPDADRTVINVSRCYADRLVQVAEFCSPVVSTYQCAWALCHLAGYYRNVSVNLEINGPGEAVFNEIKQLRRDTSQMYDKNPGGATSYDLRYVLSMMRYYLYSRVDSLSQTPALHSRTTHSTKFSWMSALKDSFELHRYDVKSLGLLEEMRTIVIKGGTIEAEAGKNDDRVMAAALAHEMWRKQVRPRLEAIGLTWKWAQDDAAGRGPSQAERMALNYLERSGIGVPGGRPH